MADAAIAMDAVSFWRIIAATLDTGDAGQVDSLRRELRKLEPRELIAFELAFRGFVSRAYSWDLWGAAYVMRGGCSDDSFLDFRSWLIGRGRQVYEAALSDPETLASLDLSAGPEGDFTDEGFAYVAGQVYEEKGGDAAARTNSLKSKARDRAEPDGEPFEEDEAQLAVRYPNLSRRYG